MVLVSVLVRNEEIHSFFQKLSEGLPSLTSKTKMLSLDQSDELMIINDTVLVEVNLTWITYFGQEKKLINVSPHQLFCLLMVSERIPSTPDLLPGFL